MIAVKFRTTGMRNWMIEIIGYLFIILFVYAAVTKFINFEHFRSQLGQSPFLSAFADYVAWGVPMLEILVSLLYFLPKLRLAGLWASFALMVIFSTYIIFVLFADSIPCSCGGVIASLSWSQHLIFNIGFTLLAIFGILLMQKHIKTKKIEATS
jgi:uncharacterized membrane protein YphA (DoxX/SURF4 family)